MGEFFINTDRAITNSEDILNIAVRLREIQGDLESINLSNSFECLAKYQVARSIKRAIENVASEATKMDSFGDALECVANYYRKTEDMLCNPESANMSKVAANSNKAKENAKKTTGTDKRGWICRFWDWITQKKPDDYDTTTKEQEKAADEAMKNKMREVLKNEKYSRDNWNKLSVEGKKKLLQEYMNEVIAIYGLKKVKTTLFWDSKAEYSNGSITWGYYTDGNHRVTLNERALSDSIDTWDSYDMFETVGHELRHAYQHEAIDNPTDFMVSKETIDSWSKNFKHYISSDTDYDAYRNQVVEVDARDFQISRSA